MSSRATILLESILLAEHVTTDFRGRIHVLGVLTGVVVNETPTIIDFPIWVVLGMRGVQDGAKGVVRWREEAASIEGAKCIAFDIAPQQRPSAIMAVPIHTLPVSRPGAYAVEILANEELVGWTHCVIDTAPNDPHIAGFRG